MDRRLQLILCYRDPVLSVSERTRITKLGNTGNTASPVMCLFSGLYMVALYVAQMSVIWISMPVYAGFMSC